MNKSLKECQEKQEQTNTQVKKAVQDLKMEIGAIKKTQLEGILDMEIL